MVTMSKSSVIYKLFFAIFQFLHLVSSVKHLEPRHPVPAQPATAPHLHPPSAPLPSAGTPWCPLLHPRLPTCPQAAVLVWTQSLWATMVLVLWALYHRHQQWIQLLVGQQQHRQDQVSVMGWMGVLISNRS